MCLYIHTTYAHTHVGIYVCKYAFDMKHLIKNYVSSSKSDSQIATAAPDTTVTSEYQLKLKQKINNKLKKKKTMYRLWSGWCAALLKVHKSGADFMQVLKYTGAQN